MKKYLLIVLLGLMFGCGSKSGDSRGASADSTSNATNNKYQDVQNLDNYLTAVRRDGETQKIDSTCAILIFPNEEQMAKLKKQYGEDDFNSMADDANFYQGTAMVLLDSLQIKTVTVSKRYLLLQGKESWTLDVRKDSLPEWNLIFFHTNKKPIIVPTPGLEAKTVIDYFN